MFKPAAQKSVVAVAEGGQGIRQSHLTGKLSKLKPGQILFPGDKVRCNGTHPKDRLQLNLYGETIKLKPSSNWFPIIAPPAIRFLPRSTVTRLRTFNQQPRGGRPRGSDALFESPVDGSVAWPERLRLRWTPLSAGQVVRVRVRRGNDKLWPLTDKNVTLTAGTTVWDAPELRQQLIQKQQENFTGALLLQWTDSEAFSPSLQPPPPMPGRIEGALTFTLLTLAREKQLRTDLDAIRQTFDPLTQLLYQARLFADYDLAAEAAEAYENAARQGRLYPDIAEVALNYLRNNHLSDRADRLARDLNR